MTKDEAKLLLSYHSCRNEKVDHPKWKNGFLGSLRPFKGYLIEENFREVIECIRTLGPSLTKSALIDRNAVCDIMGIIHLGRAWGVHENSMLRSNKLIVDSDWRKLEQWVEIISYTFMMVLDTGNDPEAYAEYEFYLSEE